MRSLGVSRATTKSQILTDQNDKEVFLKRQKDKEPRKLLEVNRKMTTEKIFADGFAG